MTASSYPRNACCTPIDHAETHPCPLVPSKRRQMVVWTAWAVVLSAMFWAAGGQAQSQETHRGRLSQEDQTFEGRHIDRYQFTTQPGQVLRVDMTSKDIDTRLVLISPSNVLYRVDDYLGSAEHARFEMLDLVGGDWTIVATSNLVETGDYALQIRSEVKAIGKPVIFKAGQLGSGSQIDGLHLYERYTKHVEAGQRLLVDLSARRFDTVLKVTLPGGKILTNDDLLPGTINHSRVTGLIKQAGELVVEVRSFDAEGQGRFIVQAWAQPITPAIARE